MVMQSFQSPEMNLLINVNEHKHLHIINFVFHQDCIEEAMMMVIPALLCLA
jgi:hypothetical protein